MSALVNMNKRRAMNSNNDQAVRLDALPTRDLRHRAAALTPAFHRIQDVKS
jgi:hypothetical protein